MGVPQSPSVHQGPVDSVELRLLCIRNVTEDRIVRPSKGRIGRCHSVTLRGAYSVASVVRHGSSDAHGLPSGAVRMAWQNVAIP